MRQNSSFPQTFLRPKLYVVLTGLHIVINALHRWFLDLHLCHLLAMSIMEHIFIYNWLSSRCYNESVNSLVTCLFISFIRNIITLSQAEFDLLDFNPFFWLESGFNPIQSKIGLLRMLCSFRWFAFVQSERAFYFNTST